MINENDTTATDEITFGDNDFLAALVAALLNARLLVLLTNTDGVFTADPRTDPGAELVAAIEDTQVLETIADRRVLARSAGAGCSRRSPRRGSRASPACRW